MKITVTKKHINVAYNTLNDEKSAAIVACNCPVALALKDATKRNYIVASVIAWPEGIGESIYLHRSVNLPKEVQDFILKFDTLRATKQGVAGLSGFSFEFEEVM